MRNTSACAAHVAWPAAAREQTGREVTWLGVRPVTWCSASDRPLRLGAGVRTPGRMRLRAVTELAEPRLPEPADEARERPARR